MHSVKGNAIETVHFIVKTFSLVTLVDEFPCVQIGNLTSSNSWKAAGKQEHAEGEGEYKAAQAQDYVEGTMDRLKGYKDNVMGALTGDSAQQASGQLSVMLYHPQLLTLRVTGNVQKKKGEAQQEINKPTTQIAIRVWIFGAVFVILQISIRTENNFNDF